MNNIKMISILGAVFMLSACGLNGTSSSSSSASITGGSSSVSSQTSVSSSSSSSVSSSSSSSSSATPTVTAVSITNNETLRSLQSGSLTLVATVTVVGGASATVDWTSSDETIATISSTGEVLPIKEGVATFTATSQFDVTKTATSTIQFYEARTPINGGFELVQPAWGVYSNSLSSDSASDPEQAKSGLYSYKVTNDGNYTVIWHGVNYGVENDFAVGDFITLSAYFYSPFADAGIKPRLIIESLSGVDQKAIISSTTPEFLGAANTWVKIETPTIRIPADSTMFNVKVEFHEIGMIYVDNVEVQHAESNDTTFSSVKLDDIELANYQDTIDDYEILVASASALPIITATATDATSTVVITQATSETMAGSIVITAADGTVRTIALVFFEANAVDLTAVSVDGAPLTNFNANRLDYYQLLNRGTTVIPTITVEKVSSAATADIVYPVSLPGVAVITVSQADMTKEYSVYLDVIAENRLMIYYPDTNFERTPSTGLLQNWGTFQAGVSTEKSHSGLQSLKAETNGGSGWVGFDLAGGVDYPARGDSLRTGMWVYATAVGDVTMEIYGKEAQGQIVNFVHTITLEEVGHWVYIESTASTPVAMDASYAQIVVKNYSQGAAYFDDIALFRVGA